MDKNVTNPPDEPSAEEAKPSEEAQPAEPSKEVSKDARMWGMLCHLLGLGWLIVPVIGGVIGSLIMWQIKKEEDPFIDKNGKEALNFQISMLIYAVVSGALFVICVGPFLLAAVALVDLIFAIIASVKANSGVAYRYPLTIRFIK